MPRLLKVDDSLFSGQGTAAEDRRVFAVCLILLARPKQFLGPDCGRALDRLCKRECETDGSGENAQLRPQGVLRVHWAHTGARRGGRRGIVGELKREADDGRRERVEWNSTRRCRSRRGGGEGDEGADESGD